MRYPELQTHLWNLSRVALPCAALASTVLAGCGPFVDVPGIETDSDSVGETDPTGSTVPPNTTTPPGPDTGVPGECTTDLDCPPSFSCFGGVCQYDPYYGDTCAGDPCCSYGECPGDTDTDGPYVECYAHPDCGETRVCNERGVCEDPQSVPSCDEEPAIVPLSLPTAGEGEILSLAFVDADANPWQDLVVGRSGSAELVLGPGDEPPIALPVPPGATVIDAAAGDLDGDGQAELVLSTQEGAVLVLRGDGMGGYVQAAAVQETGPVLDLAPLHFNLDGTLDLAFRVEGGPARVYWGDGMGGFAEMYTLSGTSGASGLVGSDLEGDTDGDLLVQVGSTALRFEGSNAGNLVDDGELPGGGAARGLLSGTMGPVPVHDVVGYGLEPMRTLLELWPDGQPPQYWSVLGDPKLWAGMGDLDADGVADVVLAGQGSIDYVRGSAEPSLACVATYLYPSTATTRAIGDFDGDLRADVALAGPEGITVLLTQ